MMRALARCPASCGELLQGLIEGQERLVSCPVNLYSTVELTVEKRSPNGSNSQAQVQLINLPGVSASQGQSQGQSQSQGQVQSQGKKQEQNQGRYAKILAALQEFLRLTGEKDLTLDRIQVKVQSSIQRGKGLASSTADICAAVAALAELMQYRLSEEELARIAVAVEPTDSILFKDLTLFDHLSGAYIERLGPVPKFDILLCEGYGIVDTLTFRTDKNYLTKLRPRDNALAQMRKGIANQDLAVIGQAATASACLNQDLLPKPYLDELLAVADQAGALGVNVAHSGTVCGIICGPRTDQELLRYQISRSLKAYFCRTQLLSSVGGGTQIIEA